MSEIPANANENCVGPSSSSAGRANACAGCPNQSVCASGAFSSPEAIAKAEAEKKQIQTSLSNVSHVILVLSGKGGVGKSTLASQLSHTLAHRGFAVGLLDVDICGPSVPRMAGVMGREVHQSGNGWTPVYSPESPNLACMSISFLLQTEDAAVVWRGPRKNALIKQFLTETDWGEDGLDYLIVDTPPGTSDEHISTVQHLQAIGGVSGAIVVTTPEEVSMADVRKELNFCTKTKVPVLGVVENMSHYQTKVSNLTFSNPQTMEDCTPHVLQLLKAKCPEVLDLTASADIFPSSGDGPRGMAAKFGAPYWGAIPLDPNLLQACENGKGFVENYPESPAVSPLNSVVDQLTKALPVEVVGMEE